MQDNAEAQYALGYEYYHFKRDIHEAVNWCLKAADQQHENALTY